MEDLRVPKRRTPVEVLLPGGAVRRLIVFLSEFAHTHAGAERLSDLLIDGQEFLPAVDPESQAVFLLNRANIVAAKVAPEFEVEVAEQQTIPSEHEVELTLVDGHRVRGLLSFVLPSEHSRVIDFLNEAPPFFRVLEQDRVALVNKRHVVQAELINGR